MIIEVALFLMFGAIAGAFVVKAYEWHRMCSTGLTSGRTTGRSRLSAARDPAQMCWPSHSSAVFVYPCDQALQTRGRSGALTDTHRSRSGMAAARRNAPTLLGD
jgi:hypothetical protein